MTIKSVREVFNSGREDENGIFWTYLICHVESGLPFRFDLIRIDSLCEKMERLGCELTLDHCRQLIKKYDSDYE